MMMRTLAITSVLLLGQTLGCSTTAPGGDAGRLDAHPLDAGPTDADGDRGQVRDASAPTDGAADTTAKPVTRVLFIGNSYTGVNQLPVVLRELGRSSQSPVSFEVAQHTPGGARWEEHDANPAVDQLIQKGWDHVVLQDQSGQPWVVGGIKPALPFAVVDQRLR